MYSQRAHVAILLEGGAPKALPKDMTDRLKMVTGVVADMTEPPPQIIHTRTTKGGALSSGSAKTQIPDPGASPGLQAPQAVVPTMAPGVAGGSSAGSTFRSGAGQADVALAAAAQPGGQAIPLSPVGPGPAVADASPAPAGTALPGALVLSALPGDPAADGTDREVRGGTRTPAPRSARTTASYCLALTFPQDPADQVAEAEAALAAATLAEAAMIARTILDDAPPGSGPTPALPDTPSGSVIEVQAELDLCPWAEHFDPADCSVLAAAWQRLSPLDHEQIAYALVRLMKDTDITDAPKFDRVRVGALAVLSATYRRLHAHDAPKGPVDEDDAQDAEHELDAPNFLAPMLARIALAIHAKAQAVVVDDAAPDEKTLKVILGSLKRKSDLEREQAARLYRAARRALPNGAAFSQYCLAASLAILALKTMKEIDRLKLPEPDVWLGRYTLLLEEAAVGPIFTGQIGPMVAQEREPPKVAVSTAVPSLKTESSHNATLHNQNRSPCYNPDMRGWLHADGDHQDGWTGVGLQAVPVHPDAICLPEPLHIEGGYKLACPATVGVRLPGNHCLNCSTKKLKGGCVNRFDKSKSGVAHNQGHLSMFEIQVFAMLWNVDGVPCRKEDVGALGFPAYLGDDPPLGRPLPEKYTLDRRPCGLPSLRATDPPPGPLTGSAPAGGTDPGDLGACEMFRAMVDARPSYTSRAVVYSKSNATMLASTAREQALPVTDRALYPPTVAGALAAHPLDRPDLYCFYRYCVPLDRVPVQLLPWLKPAGAKAGSAPHPSWSPSWATTADGQAFFRMSEEEQAQALAEYDAGLERASTPATGSPPPVAAAAPRPKRARAVDRPASSKKPKRVKALPDGTDDESDDGSSLFADSVCLLQVIVLNDPSEDPAEPGQSAAHAQNLSLDGSRALDVSAHRREVVLQGAMTTELVYAKAGCLDGSKPIARNLHTEAFRAAAQFSQPGGAAYWPEYGRLLLQIVEWLEMRSSGKPEISDIGQALRDLPERRTARVMGRLRSFREGPSEAQHLHSYPLGGYPPVPGEVSQVIKGGLLGCRNPALTAERLMKLFAYPVDDFTVEWLMLARFNGGILPGLAGETNTIDSNGVGPPLPFDHSYGPLTETVLHLVAHLASGMPIDGEAPPPLSEESPSGSAAVSVVDLSSGGEQTSDGEASAAATLATVAGARLASLLALQVRLSQVAALAPVAEPHAEGVALLEYRPNMARSSWPGRISAPMLLVLGAHTAPSILLLMEIRYPVPTGSEIGRVDQGYTTGSRGLTEFHQALVDVYISYPAKEEAALLARDCAEGSAQGDDGPEPDTGFTGPAQALEPIGDHLGRPALVELLAGTRPSEVAMDLDRRGAAALFLPQCEEFLATQLAAALGVGGVGTDPPTAAPGQSRRLPRRQASFLRGEAGEWASYDGGRARVRCVLAVVSPGTGAPDPRSAREVVAAFSEALVGDSSTPEEVAALADVSRPAAKRAKRRAGSSAEVPVHRYVPKAGATKSRFGLATGPCRLLQRGSLYARDTPDQPEDCAPSLRLARLSAKPTSDILAQYFIGRYVTSIAAMRWAVALTSLSQTEYANHFLDDERQYACPQFFACHPSIYEPHVGTETAEEAAVGYWTKQTIDLRGLPLVMGLKGGYENVAQLALSLMGFCRDLGPMRAEQRHELMAIAGAVPARLLRNDAAATIQEWPKVPAPCPHEHRGYLSPDVVPRSPRRTTASACTPRPTP